MHGVQVYPGGVFETEPRLHPLYKDAQSNKLWVDVNLFKKNLADGTTLLTYAQQQLCDEIFFYDWWHIGPCLDPKVVDISQDCLRHMPTTFVSLSPRNVQGISCVHFDYMWNRCKSAFLNKLPGWKQSRPENYNQWPLSDHKRPYALLTLNRNNHALKQLFFNHVQFIPGHHSNYASGLVLPPDEANDRDDYFVSPPARQFLDETYISAQIESRFIGDHVVFSEKTYDFLIQPRMVLNFGPRHFYRTLAQQGWRLYRHIDYDWDDIPDSPTDDIAGYPVGERFDKFVSSLTDLCSDLKLLHEIFLDNQDIIAHNQRMLQEKPFNKLELDKRL